MKTKTVKKIVVAVSSIILCGVGMTSTMSLNFEGLKVATVEAAEARAGDIADVGTLKEFDTALRNVNITTINVTKSIKFTGDIHNIPARNLTINGNKDQGVEINSHYWSIYGKQGTEANSNAGRNNTLSIVNAKIVGDQGVGRFFTGGAGNGPSSFGWDVYAKDVTYTGARFVHLSEGKLTFDGTNDIQTRCENAWVHDLVFMPGSVYNGQAAMKDHGQFSAFYFNGRLIKGKATGTVNIGDKAQVNVIISPQSNVNHYYPVFYDKVYQVNVGKQAKLWVDAAGVAFQFIPRGDYQNIPSLNLDTNSYVEFNGRGGGNYATVKLQQYGAQVNQEQGSKLYMDGYSSIGVVESIYEYASFNLYNATQFWIANHRPNSPLFKGDRTFVRGALRHIYTWPTTGGDYPANEITASFLNNTAFSTYVGLLGDATNNNVSGEVFSRSADTRDNFQMANYGKIVFTSGGQIVDKEEKPR